MDQETQCNASIAGYELIKHWIIRFVPNLLLGSMIWELHVELLYCDEFWFFRCLDEPTSVAASYLHECYML